MFKKTSKERAGIGWAHYIALETRVVDYYPKEIVAKLATLFGTPAENQLDDYNRFQYQGQGRTIQACRENLA